MKKSRDFILVFSTLFALLLVPAVPVLAEGYLYTSLNGEGMNQLIAFKRNADGTLGRQRAYATGSLGGANINAGGDARGDFDSQGAIQIIDNALLVANAGGNTISVFDLDRTDGTVSLNAVYSSGGIRPVSIAFTKRGSGSEYWVAVGNQWNNPNAQKGGRGEGRLEQYPNAEFHKTGHKAVNNDRNLYLFAFDARTKRLNPVGRLDSYVGTNGGPTTIAFNRDGSKLAAATWGIAHFATKNPTAQKPSRVYVYDFDKKTGAVKNRRFFEEQGIAGSIGMEWDKNSDHLYVSNFNLAVGKDDQSFTILHDDGRRVRKTANFSTGNGPDIDEACWVLISPDGKYVYVSSFSGNFISVFHLPGKDGVVAKIGSGRDTALARRKPGTPAGDTKDMYISPDGKHLYNIGAYQSFTISKFDIAEDGTLTLDKEYAVKAATRKGAGVYNFLGLAGFDQ